MQKQGDPQYKKIDNFFFDPKTPLGKGAFATVYKAFDESRGNMEVAVKMVPAAKLLESEEQYNLFMREIEVLRQIKGDHIVQLIDVKRTPNNLYIFTDFCDGGDLEKQLKSKKSFTEEEALSILKQVADAFITLDSLQIFNAKGHKIAFMHRDIKPANILFHKGQIKVADFGFAKIIDEVDKNARKAHTLLGTPLYMAPQILNDEGYSPKCDIWSTGVLVYELIFGKLPWTGYSVPNLYENIKKKSLEFPKSVKSDTKDLISRMLKMKDEDRLGWKEIFDHPALKNIKLNKPSDKKVETKVEPKKDINHNPYVNNINQYAPQGQQIPMNQNLQGQNQYQMGYGNLKK